jgi:fibronectin-binding autotransporter adhesin
MFLSHAAIHRAGGQLFLRVSRPQRSSWSRFTVRLAFALAAFNACDSGRAATITWTSTVAGNWSDASNWTPASVPTLADDVVLNNGSTVPTISLASGADMASLTLDGPSASNVLKYGGATPFVQNMYGGTGRPLIGITSNASAAVSFTKANFRMRVSGDLDIAAGKTLTLANSYISENSAGLKLTKTGAGTLAFSGSGSPKIQFTGGLDMAEGTWIASQNASALPASGLVNFTNAVGSAATITVSTAASIEALGGGNANSLVNGSSVLSVTGGQTTTYAGIIGGAVGLTHSGSGSLTLSGANTYTGVTRITGGVLSTGLLADGGAASGIGQASNAATNLVIDGGTLRYTGAGVRINRAFTVGVNGAEFDTSSSTGTLWINATAAFTGSGARSITATTGTGTLRLGTIRDGTGGSTSVVKQGTGTLLLTGTDTYTGQLQILQGVAQIGNAATGGASTGAGHSVAISSGAELRFRQGGGVVLAFNAPISGAGAVQFNYNNLNSGGSLTLGGNNTFTGDLTLNPTSGTNVLTLLAGSTTALGAGNVVFGQYGRLDLNGFDVTTGLLRSSAGTNGIVTNDGATDVAFTLQSSSSQTYGGVIENGTRAISIIKSGSGTQTLSGANTYTGTTTVGGGTLAITGSLAGGAVSVQSGATLGGSGTIGGATSILGGGILAPGTSPGTLTITNTLALADTSILSFELDAADQTVGGGINDLVTGVTDLTLGGVLNVTGIGDFSTVPQGTMWRLIDYSGSLIVNGFTIGSAPALASGLSYEVDTGTAGQVNLVVVPEPATFVWLLAGGIGIAAARRFRNRR